MSETKFIFIRHGESEGNALNLCQGHLEYPLSSRGIKQAQDAAIILKSQPISRIVSSPLKRARQTAQKINNELGLPAITEQVELMERYYGTLQGQPSDLMLSYEQSEVAGMQTPREGDYQVEPKHAVFARLKLVLSSLENQKGLQLVVSHGRLFNFLSELLAIDKPQQLPNCIPVLITQSDRVWSAEVLGAYLFSNP